MSAPEIGGENVSDASKSVYVFGLYLLGLGAVLTLAPNLLLGIFAVPATSEVWIHVVGMLVLFLGVYYLIAAKNNLMPFLAWSVRLRATVIIFFLVFVLTGLAPPTLLLFGAIDLAGAVWTWRAIRRGEKGHPMTAA